MEGQVELGHHLFSLSGDALDTFGVTLTWPLAWFISLLLLTVAISEAISAETVELWATFSLTSAIPWEAWMHCSWAISLVVAVCFHCGGDGGDNFIDIGDDLADLVDLLDSNASRFLHALDLGLDVKGRLPPSASPVP